jgi:hypothetical protein
MQMQHPNGYRIEITDLTEECKMCAGSGKRRDEKGDATGPCLVCKGQGCLLSDGVSGFIVALLDDDDVYERILKVAQRLKFDLKHS